MGRSKSSFNEILKLSKQKGIVFMQNRAFSFVNVLDDGDLNDVHTPEAQFT